MTSREAQKEQNIRQYYTELNKFGQAGEYEKAVKAANKSEFEIFCNLRFIQKHACYVNFSPQHSTRGIKGCQM